jgi:hypothetical protein
MLKADGNADSNSVKSIDSYIIHSQNFAGEIKEFVKERADLERQYGFKLKSLFVKYSKDNKKTSIFGTASESVALSEEGSDDLDLGSLRNSFSSILNELEMAAAERLTYADKLSSGVIGTAKDFVVRTEEKRKSSSSFLQQLHKQLNLLEQESHACRQTVSLVSNKT